MHVNLEISAGLPTHRVARSIWIPEFYTLEELSRVLQASIGWESRLPYTYHCDEMSWLPCDQFSGEDVSDGQFVAEGTTLNEVMEFWDGDGATFQTGKREIWEFALKVRGIRDTHPDNMTCMLMDGHGDMPTDYEDLQRMFLETHDKLVQDGSLLLGRANVKSIQTEHTIGLCAELVACCSAEISRSRRLPQY